MAKDVFLERRTEEQNGQGEASELKRDFASPSRCSPSDTPGGTLEGQMAITEIWPTRTLIGYNLCIVVANVLGKPTPEKLPAHIPLYVHLNSVKFSDFQLKARPTNEPQALIVKLTSAVASENPLAKDWASLLKGSVGVAGDNLGEKTVFLGVSRSDTTMAEAVATVPVRITVFHWIPAGLGSIDIQDSVLV